METRLILRIIAGGMGLAGVLIVAVFLTGNTFGQRCAKLWPENSVAWQSCVERFANGRPLS